MALTVMECWLFQIPVNNIDHSCMVWMSPLPICRLPSLRGADVVDLGPTVTVLARVALMFIQCQNIVTYLHRGT